MNAGLLIARLALAVVFFLAGAAKLSDRAGTRATLVSFGLPPALASLVGVGLPLVELLVAIALLPAATANWGALGALILLGVFIVAIVNLLARGREAECHCFGQLQSARVGGSTLARNVSLAGIAAFVLLVGRGRANPSYLDWFGGLATLEWVVLLTSLFALGLLATGAWFGMHLMRQHGRILLRLDALEKELAERGLISAARGGAEPAADGLPVGTTAPSFDALNLRGGSTSLRELLAPGLPVMLVFTNPECAPCTAVLPDIAQWQRGHATRLTIALISQGTLERNRVRFAGADIRHVLVQRDREISDVFGAWTTPSALLISQEGTVASAVAQGAVAVRGLVGSIVPGPAINPQRSVARAPHDLEQGVSTPLVSFDAG